MITVKWMASLRTAATAVVLAPVLAACTPLVTDGALNGSSNSNSIGVFSSDRRTSRAQLDDEAIEARAKARVEEAFRSQGLTGDTRVVATSYNRVLLLTGQVSSDTERQAAGNAAAQVPNVRRVVNEILVNPTANIFRKTSDALLTTQVKTALATDPRISARNVKVVSEMGQVYLMGIVTQDEANTAAELARKTPGVHKVVLVFEAPETTTGAK